MRKLRGGFRCLIARVLPVLMGILLVSPLAVAVVPDDDDEILFSIISIIAANKAPTISLTSPVNNQQFNAPASIMFRAAVGDPEGKIREVKFFSGAQLLNATTAQPNTTLAPGTYSYTWTNVIPGTYSLSVQVTDHLGKTVTSNLVAATVVNPPTVAGGTANILGTVTNAQTTRVDLYSGLSYIGTVAPSSTGTFIYSWSGALPGSYTITAREYDSAGNLLGVSNQTINVSSSGEPNPSIAQNFDYLSNGLINSGQPTVGATAGSFEVSDLGAAQYTIPITVPPSTAGMTPSLALSYSSRGGNDLAGVGWSLSGLSVIYRCPKNFLQDNGQKGKISYDANDRYCLDGQRLVQIGSFYDPIEGLTGTEYRTERESYSRIVSFRKINNDSLWIGPEYFKVLAKSGQIMYYGFKSQDPDSQNAVVRNYTPQHTGRLWAVYRVEDRKGNYLTIRYTKASDETSHRPESIWYGGNRSVGQSPYAHVSFEYETRTDNAILYDSDGKYNKLDYRLKAIKTYADSTFVKQYILTYASGYSAATSRSLLRSIKECSGTGLCLPETQFLWQDYPTNGLNEPGSGVKGNLITDYASDTQVADLNGDGRSDLISYINNRTWKVCLGTQSGFSSNVWSSPGSGSSSDGKRAWRVADLTGDGLADLMTYSGGGNVWKIHPSVGNGFGPSQSWTANINARGDDPNWPEHLGDFNGDGRIDFAKYNNNSTWYICLAGQSSFSDCNAYSGPMNNGFSTGWRDVLAGDFNGDGRADMVVHQNNSDQWQVCFSKFERVGYVFGAQTGFDCKPYGTAIPQNADKTHIADFNGDGLADLTSNISTTTWRICLSRGDGAFNCADWTGHDKGNDANVMGDFNGDGRTDIAAYSGSNGLWHVCLSTGVAFSCVINLWAGPAGDLGSNKINLRAGDYNGDGKTDLILNLGSGNWHLGLANSPTPDLLTSITDGLGSKVIIGYQSLTSGPPFYDRLSGAVYPGINVQSPLYAVSTTHTSNGIGSLFQRQYTYLGLRARADGGGLLGFAQRSVAESLTGITTTFVYRQDWPRQGLVTGVGKLFGGLQLNQQGTYWYDRSQYAGVYESFPYLTVENSKDLNGAVLPSTTTRTTDVTGNPAGAFDSYGNVLRMVVSSSDSYSKTTVNTYTNDSANWILGRLQTAQVTSHHADGRELTRSSSFAYEAGTGLLTQEVIEPNNAGLRLATDYSYDSFGNKRTQRVYGGSGDTAVDRTTTTIYDNRGQFPAALYNALSQPETRQYDARFGVMTRMTGPNGLTTNWIYDSLGRKVVETRAEGTQTVWTFDRGYVAGTSAAVGFSITTNQTGSAPSTLHHDILGREIERVGKNFDGSDIRVTTQYDALGRVQRTSRPYISAPAYWNSFNYDTLGRVTSEVTPQDDNLGALTTTTDYAYGGNALVTRITKPRNSNPANNQITLREQNSQGQLAKMTDALNGVITYSYDPFGNLEVTTDPVGNRVSLFYDLRGRKIRQTDPDMGTWYYAYNIGGELIRQTDAKGQVSTLTYDALGRNTSRVEPGLTSTWFYDAYNGQRCGYSTGKLCRIDASGASAGGGYSKSFTYDFFGRPGSETTSIDGISYSLTNDYDSFGRTKRLIYPTGFNVVNQYNAQGYLAQVLNGENWQRIWQATARNADGRIAQQIVGATSPITTNYSYSLITGRVRSMVAGGGTIQNAGFAFDYLGNLNSRTDTAVGLSESFSYDALNRLTGVSGPAPKTYQYDSLGNITYKSDVGNYLYGQTGAGPHAVTTAAGVSYLYDPNGNLISGAGRSLSYTSFNMPSQISTATATLSYSYNAEHDRIKEVGPTGATIYLHPGGGRGLFYEKELKTSGVTEHRHYLPTPEGTVGVMVATFNAATFTSSGTRYFHKDHLGSIVAVTNDAGQVTERFSYDAFGKRRNPNGTDAVNLSASSTQRGYTGHEMLDEIGLIHMNGRVYDPTLGRFMQADPYIQAPGNLQSYNRYSYVLNNPLSLTDPSGYNWWSDFWKNVGRPILAIAVAWAIGPAGYSLLGSPWASTIAAGFAAGGIQGGNLQSALFGAFTAGAFYGVGGLPGGPGSFGKVLGHAAVGCVTSAVRGGSCGSGALSAGFSEFAGPYIPGGEGSFQKVAGYSIVGGLSSVLGGGKFENGAVTAAFGYLFNECMHGGCGGNRRINQPSFGSITFENDVAGGASPDQPVNPRLATAVEGAVGSTGMNVNINSTTGGHESGPHVEGRAADINRINGMRVDNPLNVDNVRTLQEAFMRQPNVNQVLGPVHNVNLWQNAPQVSPYLINTHQDHIHINVYP